MSELPTENIVLEHLRALRAQIDRVGDDMRESRHRLASIESGIGAATQMIGHLQSTIAGQQVGFDRIGERVERIERRLEIA